MTTGVHDHNKHSEHPSREEYEESLAGQRRDRRYMSIASLSCVVVLFADVIFSEYLKDDFRLVQVTHVIVGILFIVLIFFLRESIVLLVPALSRALQLPTGSKQKKRVLSPVHTLRA
jgi:hypothetical protein